jgi:hypothetical protein
MSQGLVASDLSQLDTKGDFSPGIVMGNYTVSSSLKPKKLPLLDSFKIRLEFHPSERGFFVKMPQDQKLFVNGCKFSLYLGNGGDCDIILETFKLIISVQEILRPLIPKKETGYGRTFIAHQLFVDLHRNGAPGWWLLSDGTSHSEPRRFSDAREDMFESEGCPRLRFRLAPGELEAVEGALTPRDDGLFRVRFLFAAITATENVSRRTGEIFIVKGVRGER